LWLEAAIGPIGEGVPTFNILVELSKKSHPNEEDDVVDTCVVEIWSHILLVMLWNSREKKNRLLATLRRQPE
jgi:hypothetical protein